MKLPPTISKGITAVLTGWRRPQNLSKQLEAIRNQTIAPTDIMFWNNYGGPGYEPPELPEVKTSLSNYNFKFYSRFAFALLARTEYLTIFDDDTIPGPRWFENCLTTMSTHPGLLGTRGIVLKNHKKYHKISIGWDGYHNLQPQEVDLVGHAWFFRREWLKYLWMENPISWENGEDIVLSFLLQKYGGIKTYVPPHPENDRSLWGSIRGKELGSDSVSSHKNQRTNMHRKIRDEVVRRAIKGGWSIFIQRNPNHPLLKKDR